MYRRIALTLLALLFAGCSHNSIVSTVDALNARKLRSCGEINGAVNGGMATGAVRLRFATGEETMQSCKDAL